ncbi:uncharacterized protein J3R85_003482 [Psidium guajava]|nr:uncharacterized protein J3R85_003482 [Psidium guajava]
MDQSPPIRPRPRRHVGGRGGRGSPRPLQQHQNPCIPHAEASTPAPSPAPAFLMRPQDHHHHHRPNLHQHHLASNIHRLERIDRAVAKARLDLLAAGESVSSWKVSEAAVFALQVDSWSSLGFSMQQVPSLGSLMAVEGKINAFIHCFVETRRITSLYDLERAICKNEGIERFEELELGPFLRYPLRRGRFDIGELLSFIAEEKSVSGVEKLGVRIRNLGCVLSFLKFVN